MVIVVVKNLGGTQTSSASEPIGELILDFK